jgi:hypothetical protein
MPLRFRGVATVVAIAQRPSVLDDREWLGEHRITRRETLQKMTDLAECSRGTVTLALRRHDLPTARPHHPLFDDRAWLIEN